MTDRKVLIVIGITAVLLGVWFFWFRHHLDKQKFERIEASLDELTARMADEFGAEVAETKRYCSNEARKFEKGPMNCHVATVITGLAIEREQLVNFVTEQHDLATDDSGVFRFRLLQDSANCYVKNSNRGAVETECSKRATGSHFQYVE